MLAQNFENKRWQAFSQKQEFRHQAALSLISKGPVLDVGCGDGFFLSLSREKGIDAQGVDFSDVAVARCKERGLKAVQADIAAGTLPFPAGTFPVVAALDVLEHVYDPSLLLAEMKRVSSGTVIISVPNFSSLPARLQVLFGQVPENNRPNKGHIYWFNWSVLRSLVERNSLRIDCLFVNAPLERIPLIRFVTRALARLLPNLFALSFVVRCGAQRTHV